MPQPTSFRLSPASVYVTVSRSGLTCRPQCSRPSALSPTTATPPAGNVRYNPSASFAPPTPPHSAVIIATPLSPQMPGARAPFLAPPDSPAAPAPAAHTRPARQGLH